MAVALAISVKPCDAGIEIGLPNITFVGVAAALGVSHMVLYKHVASLECWLGVLSSCNALRACI